MSPAVSDTLRLQRGAEHVHRLGARALAELLAQVAREGSDLRGTLDLLDAWRDGLSPTMVRAAGGDCFPPRVLHEVRA
ncbi:MAG: hypothetical protein ACRYHQ_28275 [Janthinobacterium lividum]